MGLPLLHCVGPADIDRLFSMSLVSATQNLRDLERVVVVTPDPDPVRARLQAMGPAPVPIDVRADHEVLPASLASLPGWSRQQAIKLSADRICDAPRVLCLGADTVLLRSVGPAELLEGGEPVLYYNRYPYPCGHLDYERRRVRHVARLLGVEPHRSLPLGDFILDLMLFDRRHLVALREHLQQRHGPDPLARLLPASPQTLEDKVRFGEWTLVAVFILDVLQASPPIRNAQSRYLAQVHSQRELERFNFDARVVHFVSKQFNLTALRARLKACGLREHF